MSVAPADKDDGITYISQSRLIALQGDARALKRHKPVIRSRMNGNYLSSFKGRGMEFDEARPYQPGDDIRNMDWRVTARTNKPHSKVFREERERPVLLWVDFRAPMFFGTRQCFKSVLAARVAALLGWKASQQGDRLGALLFSQDRHLELRPGRGKTATLHVIKQLSEFSVDTSDADHQAHANGQDAAHALNRLVQVARPGSLIYMISDFRHIPGQFESALNRLSRHNELVMIHISDPLESELPESGVYRVTDGETEAQINTSAAHSRSHYHHRFTSLRSYLQALCLRNRIRYLPLSTAQQMLAGLQEIPGSYTGGTR
jgi:uncharacterized protein (DUF58 family)